MIIVALGRGEILYRSIEKMVEKGYDIKVIIVCKEAPDYSITTRDFKELAEKIGSKFIETEILNIPTVNHLIEEEKPDIGISVNWRTLIKQDFINNFPFGVINAHAGDLPRYRGNAVPNWAIINGENKIVLTIHEMIEDLDAGPILLQRDMAITQKTSIGEVYEFLNREFPEMFLEVVRGLSDKSINRIEQNKDPSLSLRCYPRIPKDGEIDWSQKSIYLDRLVRAVSEPFAGAYSYIGTEKITIWKAHHEKPEFPFLGSPGQVAGRRLKTGEVVVITGEGFLVLEEVELKNAGRRKATEVIKTIRTRLGMDVTSEIIKLRKDIDELNSRNIKDSY
jgi:UDP-4-amino-4-deoxy-L-arabinose formyltransferase/UDP-glucuronic acid dehydrogenase (UDP-4-keto-hexauronic acid decarboxylating)